MDAGFAPRCVEHRVFEVAENKLRRRHEIHAGQRQKRDAHSCQEDQRGSPSRPERLRLRQGASRSATRNPANARAAGATVSRTPTPRPSSSPAQNRVRDRYLQVIAPRTRTVAATVNISRRRRFQARPSATRKSGLVMSSAAIVIATISLPIRGVVIPRVNLRAWKYRRPIVAHTLKEPKKTAPQGANRA